MNNPFSKLDRRQLSKASIIDKTFGVIVRIPKFLLWLLSCMIPPTVRIRIAKLCGALLAPLTSPIEWLKVWVLTREWMRVLWAVPFIVLVFAFGSFRFIYVNTPKSELFADQLRNASIALLIGDYEKADFLHSRLITVEGLDNSPELLYQAMIAASRAGRIEAAIELDTRLKRDYQYAPAMKASAIRLLESNRPDSSEFEEGMKMLRTAAEKAATVQNRDENWAYYIERAIQSGRFTEALDAFNRIEGFKPRSALRVVEVYTRLGEPEKALEVLSETRVKLDVTEPGQFLIEKVGARVIASASAESEEERFEQLKEAKSMLDFEIGYITSEEDYQQTNMQANLWLVRDFLKFKMPEARKLLLQCMDDLLQAYQFEYSRTGIETTFLDLSNPLSELNMPNESWKACLADGVGVNIWHVVSGFSAWANSKERVAKLHFQIAIKSAPESANMIRSIIYSISSDESDKVKAWLNYANPQGFLKLGRTREELTFAMLEQLREVEQPASYATILLIARLRASARDWSRAIDTIEPELDRFEGAERANLVQVLVLSYQNSGRSDDAEKLITIERAKAEEVEPLPDTE